MTSVNAQHEALLDELLKDYTDPQDILVVSLLAADKSSRPICRPSMEQKVL